MDLKDIKNRLKRIVDTDYIKIRRHKKPSAFISLKAKKAPKKKETIRHTFKGRSLNTGQTVHKEFNGKLVKEVRIHKMENGGFAVQSHFLQKDHWFGRFYQPTQTKTFDNWENTQRYIQENLDDLLPQNTRKSRIKRMTMMTAGIISFKRMRRRP